MNVQTTNLIQSLFCIMLSCATGVGETAVGRFEICDHPVELHAVNSSRAISVLVSFRTPGTNASTQFDWKLAAKPGTREHNIVLLFLHDQALRYVEGNTVNQSITVKSAVNPEALENARKERQRWFFTRENAEYSQRTLALRSAGKLIEVLPLKPSDTDNWLPWTRESYSEWWRRVSDQLGLSNVFGRPI